MMQKTAPKVGYKMRRKKVKQKVLTMSQVHVNPSSENQLTAKLTLTTAVISFSIVVVSYTP